MSRTGAQAAPQIDALVPVVRQGSIAFDAPVIPGTHALWGKRPHVLVPGEEVLAVAVDLPLASHRQRLEAVGFAVEGLLAQPLGQVHVALGPQISPKRYLAVMVAHETMRQWTALLNGAGLPQARLVPDFLALPSMIEDGWTVFASEGRAIVRRSDLSGFSTTLATLPAAWRLAGCPDLASCGDPLPAFFNAAPTQIPTPRVPDIVAAEFTLGQGPYSTSAFHGSGILRRAALVCATGLAVLGAISVADTIALHRLAQQRRDAAQELISRVAPNSDPAEDIENQLARILPQSGRDRPGRFLPLFADVAKALENEAGGMAVDSLVYDAADGQLGFEVAAEDLAALQRIEASMVNAGLRASSGVATAESGAAKARIVVDDGTGGS